MKAAQQQTCQLRQGLVTPYAELAIVCCLAPAAAALAFSVLLLLSVSPQAPQAVSGVDKQQLIADVRAALYCSKVCSYAQGMNIIKKKSDEKGWGVDLGGLARIWKVGQGHRLSDCSRTGGVECLKTGSLLVLYGSAGV